MCAFQCSANVNDKKVIELSIKYLNDSADSSAAGDCAGFPAGRNDAWKYF